MQKLPENTRTSTARIYGGQEQHERMATRRQRFIEAGIELFGSVGYQATTMRTLTAKAELTNRYFYELFETMEDLLIACYEQVMNDFGSRLQQVMEHNHATLKDRLRAATRCYFEEIRKPCFARITQVEVIGVSARLDALYIKAYRVYGKQLIDYLCVKKPPSSTIQERELAILGEALAGAMSIAGAMWMRSRYQDDIDTLVDAILKILMGTAQILETT